MNEFKPGLDGVVAVETEIAEPDREGGSLRYRGVDIEELVGRYPYEHVWGLLVDDDIDSAMPEPEPYAPPALTGNAPADLQAETASSPATGGSGKLNEITDEQARQDLGRLSAQMMSIVARSARVADGHTDAVPDESSRPARPPRRGSCSAGAGRPIRGTSRRSTPTGSAPRSTASTRRRSRPAWSPRPVPTAVRRSRRRSARCPARCTAAPPRT